MLIVHIYIIFLSLYIFEEIFFDLVLHLFSDQTNFPRPSFRQVIAYAMKSRGWSLKESMEYVKKCRSIVDPNAGFQKQLSAVAHTSDVDGLAPAGALVWGRRLGSNSGGGAWR